VAWPLTPSRWFLLAIGLLLAAGAIPVGLGFVVRPDGALVGMPRSVLAGSPFTDFLIPGLLLAVGVGGSTLTAAVFVARGVRRASRVSLAAGALVVGWIAVLVWLIGFVSALQPLVCGLGLAMIALAAREPR
jgi:hypothetical protein